MRGACGTVVRGNTAGPNHDSSAVKVQDQKVKMEKERKRGTNGPDWMREACCTGTYFVFKPHVLPLLWQWLSRTVVER